MNMNTNMGNTVYWHKNQVIIKVKLQLTSFASQPTSSTSHTQLINTIANTILPHLDTAFNDLNLNLQVFDWIPIRNPRSPANSIASADNFDLLYFCHIPNAQPDMGSMQVSTGTTGMSNEDHTLAVINQFDHGRALQKALASEAFSKAFQNEGLSVNIDTIDTIPHWFWAGTDLVTQGCPISPPFPVEEASTSGQWKLQFSQLPHALQGATGEGVTVFVLDTLPTRHQISKAADQAGSSNMLLQEMTHGMKWEEPFNAVPPAINFNYQPLPDIVEGTPPERVVTGKDIYGRHVGFPMEDHGLFIAGIVRDLAPGANIECIRVLNDFGVGDLRTLCIALNKIYDRMSKGDLQGKPVVINLSLVVLPPEDDIPEGVTEAILKQSKDLLNLWIQGLADQGAIFAAAAGNDSDPRMDASEERFGPRYPAALASDDPPVTTMIPVGAVNRKGRAAMYSNHPGPNGIATFGGELPKPDPWLPSAMSHTVTHVDQAEPIDALHGIYSASMYPALSKNDHHPTLPAVASAYPMYHASNTWACWSGTSFATPIISALAARILQGRDPGSVDVQQAIIDAATGETTWTRVGAEDIFGPMIMVEQAWFPPVDPPNPNQ